MKVNDTVIRNQNGNHGRLCSFNLGKKKRGGKREYVVPSLIPL
jgi:hypothetical protein